MLLLFYALLGHCLAGPYIALHSPGGPKAATRSRSDFRSSRKPTLEELFVGLLVGAAHNRMAFVEKSIQASFDAAPKNLEGLIPPSESLFSSIVRRYFAKEHGWLIVGLEPPGPLSPTGEVHETEVLVAKAPSVAEALKDAFDSGRGFSFVEVVSTVASIERLILKESLWLLERAYSYNDLQTSEALNASTLDDVLATYLLLFRAAKRAEDFSDVDTEKAQVAMMKARAKAGTQWEAMLKFIADVRAGANAPYSFTVTSDLMYSLAERYGKWQNSECIEMKEVLMRMSDNGTGVVDFERFHSEPTNSIYSFSESRDYLHKAGSLEAADGDARVLIPNYLLGRTNCIAPSKFHSVCCLNACEDLVDAVEERTKMPAAAAGTLLDVVRTVSSPTVVAPRELPRELRESLFKVAAAHHHVVPLFSADFRRWLHYAFPNECPLPTGPEQAAEEAARMSSEEWLDLHGKQPSNRVPNWMHSFHEEI